MTTTHKEPTREHILEYVEGMAKLATDMLTKDGCLMPVGVAIIPTGEDGRIKAAIHPLELGDTQQDKLKAVSEFNQVANNLGAVAKLMLVEAYTYKSDGVDDPLGESLLEGKMRVSDVPPTQRTEGIVVTVFFKDGTTQTGNVEFHKDAEDNIVIDKPYTLLATDTNVQGQFADHLKFPVSH